MKLSKKSLMLTLALTTAVVSASSSAYANSDAQQSSVQNELNSFKAATAAAQQTKAFTFNKVQNELEAGTFTTSGGSIPLTVVQWTDDSNGSPVVEYRLKQQKWLGKTYSITVNGTFTNVNTTRTFTNVDPGEYKLMVYNVGSYSVSGNGNLKYN